MINHSLCKNLSKRFRGLLPIVIDLETSGLNPQTDAILELAAVTLSYDEKGKFRRNKTYAYQVEPFSGAHLDPEALELTKIDPTYPLRYAIPERQALHRLFRIIRELLAETQCHRAVLVGHNAWFDLSFIQAAALRSQLTDSPFHSFTTFDTATLAGVVLGETVLARAVRCAKIPFDINQAHTAIYDAERTAELFCYMVNRVSVISMGNG
jgi:ribonuclease T